MTYKYDPEKSRQYYLEHRYMIKKKRRERYRANPEPVKEASKQWRKDNRLLVNLREKLKYWDDPEYYRAKARESMKRSRARKKLDAQGQVL